jgi:cytochrome oxidase Cu insertion factor (SCO1/SenC/PrrC family)
MRQRVFGVRLAFTLLLALSTSPAAAQALDPRRAPPDEERLLYTQVPDIQLTTSIGTQVRLSKVSRGRPLLLAFVFTRCAGVCSPFVRSWRSAERSVGRPAAYWRLVLSFDPRDTPADMATLAHHLDVESGEDWTFAIAAPGDVRRLADVTGFWYEWDRNLNQFDHPAMLAGIRSGRLVRLLIGGSVTSARLDELVREVSGVFVPSYPLPSRARFRCVQFDGTTGRVVLDWGFALLLVPVFSTSMATMGLFMVGARRRASRCRHEDTIVRR